VKSSDEKPSRRCPNCGVILTDELPEELCPACLMQRALVPSASEVADSAQDGAPTETLDVDSPPPQRGVNDSASANRRGTESELAEGQSFGDYTIVRRLGRGGMGTVYEADHQPTGRRVALKVLSHALDNPQARARFLREGRLAAAINHPNSVYVYGTEEIGGTPTISMELIRGGTLQQWIKARGAMEVPAAVDAVLQIIDGLEAADRKGVLHRDVKPANCFIDASGTIKIGDFGLSISTGPRDDPTITNVTREGTFLGTPAFASPEQLRGDPLDRRSDIYSVGVTLFYLLTGRAPFAGENMVQLLATVLDKPAPLVRSIRGEIPEDLDLLVGRCLQKSAGQRFNGYDSLREALLPHSSMKPTPAPLGNRLIAYIVDIVLITFVCTVTTYSWQWFAYGYLLFLPRFDADRAWYNVLMTLVMLMILYFYYALSEWRFGKSLGKHLLGLRVVDPDQEITWRQASIRSAIFVIVPNMPSVGYSIMTREMTFDMMQQSPVQWIGMAVGLGYYLLMMGLFATARSRNGYAGIHELASGTRVVCKPQLNSRPIELEPAESFDSNKNDDRIGPYHVLKTLWGSETDRLVLAFDAKLLRRVWVRVQPPGISAVDSIARNLSRATRLRWLGAKRNDSQGWDCYESPTGKPLTQAIDEGLRWEATVAALRQLSQELQTACKESSLPGGISLAHLWITEEGSFKLLPFASANRRGAEPNSEADTRFTETDKDSATAATKTLRDAVQYSLAAAGSARNGNPPSGMPLSVRESLQGICDAQSVEDATKRLDAIAAQPTVNVRRRATGMLAVSLAVPTLLIASTISGLLAMEQQKARLPRVTELSKVVTMLDIERRINNEDKQQRIATIETWIAGGYRDVIEDRAQMESFYALMMIPPNRRALLKPLMMKDPPSAAETAAAKEAYETMRSEGATTVPAEIGFFSPRGLVFLAAVAWMEMIWIPSLFTAVVFRGGALLRMFGITLVNRRGQRASRLRVFIRMLVGGVPALAIAYAFLGAQVFGGPLGDAAQLAIIIAVVFVVIFAILTRRRLPHDRLAGTYLVAR
jgi:hypothetical protein